MRRIFIMLLIGCMVFSAAVSVSAAEETAGEKNGSLTETVLSIDNEHIYEGMNRSYRDGYMPVIENDTAVLVLPLLAEGAVKYSTVTASLSLGKTKTTPFVYRNYEKNVALSSYTVINGAAEKSEKNGGEQGNEGKQENEREQENDGEQNLEQAGEQLEVYCIRFDVSLTAERYNGVYPVTIQVSGRDETGERFAQSFTIYCTISDGKETESGKGNESEKTENSDDGKKNENGKTENISEDHGSEDGLNASEDHGSGDGLNANEDHGSGDGLNASEDHGGEDGLNASEDGGAESAWSYEDAGGSGDGNSSVKEEKPTSSPVVLISSVSQNPSPVMAGKEFVVTVVLRNTSTIKSVQNMVVAVSCETEAIVLKEDSSSFYVASLGKDKVVELEMHFAADLGIEEGNYPINLVLTYDDPEAVTWNSSDSFTVSVAQEKRAEFIMPSVAREVNAGDNLTLNFQVMNLGRSKLYNVRCELTGDGLLPSNTAFIGTLEAGTEGTAAMNVYIGSKDMTEGYAGTEKYGAATGTVTLIYEDENGVEYTQEESFHTIINEPLSGGQTKERETEQKAAGQWWISVLAAAILLIAGVAGFIFYQIKKSHGAK